MSDEILDALGKAKVVFWTCLVRHHGERRGPQGQIVQTVEWIDGVAHCTAPGCELTSLDTSHFRDIVVEVYREQMLRRLETEIRPAIAEDYNSKYNCCGCSTYQEILDHAIRIVKGET